MQKNINPEEVTHVTNVAAIKLGQHRQHSSVCGYVHAENQHVTKCRKQHSSGFSLAEAGLDENNVCTYNIPFNADTVHCVAGCHYTRLVNLSTALGNTNTS